MQHICKYCGKEFEKGTQLGSHIVRCEKNPRYNEIHRLVLDKVAKRAEEKYPKVEFEEVCPVCGTHYFVKVTQHMHDIGEYRHTCSPRCAHKLTTMNTDIVAKNQKISNSAVNKIRQDRKIYTCEYCGKKYYHDNTNSYKYCSKECGRKALHDKLSSAAIKNNFGGLRPETTHKYYKRGYYRGIWCDSSWELAFLLYCLDNNIQIERNHKYFEYTFEGKTYKFYPDFIVDGEFVEIKGFYTPKNKAKREQYPDIKFIDKPEINKFLDYAISEYGPDFINLYDSDNE